MIKKQNKINFEFEKSLWNVSIFSILLLLIFGRNFTGILVLDFRIGELLVGAGLVIFFFSFYLLKNEENIKPILILNSFIILFFFTKNVFGDADIFDLYLYKSSSFIWTISYLYLGYFFSKKQKISQNNIIGFNLALFLSFILGVIYYPQNIQEYFLIYSDKFEFNKAHMYVLLFVLTTFLNKLFIKSKINVISIFLIYSSIFFPLFIYKSRGAFLAVLVYTIFYLYEFRKVIITNLKVILIVLPLCLLSFIFSSFLVSGTEVSLDDTQLIVSEIISNKNTADTFLSLYIEDGRFYSTDGNINWRLQIWQDVINDSIKDDLYIFGFGFQEILPAMDDPSRKGYDGSNENVHNYFINIFGRGGIVLLISFLIFYFRLVNIRHVGLYVIPILIVSSFDGTMENPHFPIVFYFFIGYFLNIFKNYSNDKES